MATSCVPVAAAADVCANCGQEGGDGVKLKNCTACLLVKYCGVDCQRAHRKLHKKACKQRAAELKDEELYSQGHERPEGHFTKSHGDESKPGSHRDALSTTSNSMIH